MLDRQKLAHVIEQLGTKLFHDRLPQYTLAQKQWNRIAGDEMFASFIASIKSNLLIPKWQEKLSTQYAVSPDINAYTVLAVDGSQIYPDRHLAGIECFLINVGGCLLTYDATSSVRFFSEPFLFLPEHFIALDESITFSEDLVNLLRGELEFKDAYNKATEFIGAQPLLCLFDGSLIFWHLEAKQQKIIDLFLPRYLMQLHHFYEKKILNAGYISMPGSKELVNLVKLSFCREQGKTTFPCSQSACLCTQLDDLVDAELLDSLLPPFHRTLIFSNQATVVQHYLAPLKPCFFYLNVGKEIVRIEIPAWIGHNQLLVDLVATLCLNQSLKGNGYPVVLAEAHEQAVVKGFDREFFYQMVKKSSFAHHQRLKSSQKSIKKRNMTI